MVYILSVNAAVSVVLGVALLLLWNMDKEQLFTRDMGWLQILSSVPSLAFILYRDGVGVWQAVGLYTMGIGATLLFLLAAIAVNHLLGNATSKRTLGTLGITVAGFFAIVVMFESANVWIVANSALYTALGLYSVARLWAKGLPERLIGICFLGLGLNAINPLLWGVEFGAPLQASIGTVLRVILSCAFVIAALSRTQAKLSQERTRFLQLTEQSPQGMMVLDQEHIHYANPAAAKLLGFPNPQALIAAGVYATIPEKFHQQGRSVISSVVQGSGTREGWEAARIRPDGTPVYVFQNLWRTEWEGKAAAHLTLTDNTAQVAARSALQQLEQERERDRVNFAERVKNNLLAANTELEQKVAERTQALLAASNAKNQFVANMSHEIRTPMNAVLGMLKLLRGTSLTSRQLDYVTKTQGAAQSLLGLLNDILDFSKIDAGKLSLENQPFEIDRMLRDLSVILSMSASGKNIEVLFDVDPQTPAVLMGDSLRLHQVLLNLCSNAIKFTSQGQVVLRLQVGRQTETALDLHFSVEDTGIGIAEENQKHIFDVFAQADATTTRRFGGTGLGLSISTRLVEMMGGTLTLKSVEGEGSTFSFTLCLERVPDSPALPATAEAPAAQELNVLIIEDNPLARLTLAAMAKGLGWQVEVSDSGSAAIARVQEKLADSSAPYDVIFSDWNMPEMDGWTTLQRLTELFPADGRPTLVMVSANDRDLLNQRSAAEQALLDSYLVKPVTAAMLLEVVRESRAGRSPLRNTQHEPSATPKRLDGLRILLVEDNPLNQLVALELLRAEGAFVELAENGMLGVQALENQAETFDLVLMDMQMPVMDGCTATRLIRKKLKLTLPVIAMTANTMASDREACIKAGMNAHVGKPFDLAYLVEVLLQYARPRSNSEPLLNPETVVSVPASAPPVETHARTAGDDDRPAPDSVDSAGAIDRIGGDVDLYRQICEAYLLDILHLPETLQDLLANHDWDAATRILHTAKGTSSTVGALYLEAVARDGEQLVKVATESFDYAPLLAEVRHAVDQTQLALRGVLAAL